MNVKVVSRSDGILAETDTCITVELNTQGGYVGIKDGHAPYMAMVYPGWLKIRLEDGTVKQWFVHDGVITVSSDTAEVVLSEVAHPKELDRTAIEKELEDLLSQYAESDPADIRKNERLMEEMMWCRGRLELMDDQEHNS